MAQPTDNPSRFEVSEPSPALPVPALSRYARPSPQARASEPTPKGPAAETPSMDTPPPQPSPVARPLDPIVQPASDEWATDPSPPQPVPGQRPAAERAAGQTPAVREPHPRREDDASRRRPFWKRLAMARPLAEPQSAPGGEIPRDLLKPAIERIDHLTRRFEREQKALHERLDEFEHNLTRLWELEEQMGMEEIRAQLAVMRANQEETADALHALAKRVTIGAGAVVAVFAAAVIWLLL